MTRRPRLEWKSLVCVARCSVRFLMRSLSTATCTSGEPVSPSLRAYSLMISCLRGSAIDIESLLSLEVQHTHRPKCPVGDLCKRHQLRAADGADALAVAKLQHEVPIGGAEREHGLAASQAGRFGLRQGERRDVVQRRLNRKQVLEWPGTMPEGGEFIQGNRVRLMERPDPAAPKRRDVPAGTEARGQIASERADIGALAHLGLEFGVVGIEEVEKAEALDSHRACLQAHGLAAASKRIGAPARDFERRIAGRALLDLAGEGG